MTETSHEQLQQQLEKAYMQVTTQTHIEVGKCYGLTRHLLLAIGVELPATPDMAFALRLQGLLPLQAVADDAPMQPGMVLEFRHAGDRHVGVVMNKYQLCWSLESMGPHLHPLDMLPAGALVARYVAREASV